MAKLVSAGASRKRGRDEDEDGTAHAAAAATTAAAAVAGMQRALAAAASGTRAPRMQRARKESKADKEAQALSSATIKKWNDARSTDPAAFETVISLAKKRTQPRVWQLAANGEGAFFMRCVGCDVVKPALPSHFAINHGKARFLASDSGQENYNNSPSTPCKVCFARLAAIRDAAVDGWVRTIMHKYKSLCADDTTTNGTETEGWFWERWRVQGGDFVIVDGKHVITRAARCAITDVELAVGGIHLEFCASVNNRDVANKGQANHRAEDCELICAALNVAQQHEDIKDLRATFRALVEADDAADAPSAAANEAARRAEIDLNCSRSPEENGVAASRTHDTAAYSAQMQDRHLAAICSQMAAGHRNNDRKAGLANDLTAADIVAMLHALPRCAYTRALLTIVNGPLRFSVERVDDNVGHVKGNCILVSRMLNSHAGMSRAAFVAMRTAWKAREERAQ